MSTRIKEIRTLRRLTLQRLADKVGTSPQTIQRLENNTMTISVEWLERIGRALEIAPAMLLTSYRAPTVPVVGELGANGIVKRAVSDKAKALELAVPAADPIAISIKNRFGPHEPGTILIASRMAHSKSKDADGRDCLVELKDGQIVFRRVVHSRSGITAYVPYEDGSDVERNLDIAWIAPVVMTVRYMPDL